MKWDDEFKEKLTRREFFRKAGSAALAAASIGYVVTPIIGSITYEANDANTNPSPVTSGGSESLGDKLIEVKIGNSDVKLAGVSHSREFVTAHYSSLDNLVKGCSVAVLEMRPEEINRRDISNDGKAYFGTIHKMCHDYGKPIVYLDPLSKAGTIADMLIGMLGGVYGIMKTADILKKNEMPRRKILSGAKALAGFYVFNNFILGGMSMAFIADSLGVSEKKGSEFLFKTQVAHISHIVDQRNVELTNRLFALPDKIEDIKAKGDYMLVNMGSMHTRGIEFYLKHPWIRKIKSGIYGISYSLIDDDKIDIYVPTKDGWEKKTTMA